MAVDVMLSPRGLSPLAVQTLLEGAYVAVPPAQLAAVVRALHRLPYRRYYGRRHRTVRVLSRFAPYPATAQLTPYFTVFYGRLRP